MATLSNNDIKIRYVVETSNLDAAAQAFDRLTAEEKQALAELRRFNSETQNTDKNLGNIEKVANRVGKAIVGIFAYNEIKRFATSVFEATVQMDSLQKVLNFTTGSATAGARAMAYLTETSNRLGISLNAATAGYKTLSGATSQAGLSTAQTQKIFENVATAVKAFGLSSEDAKGVFLALGQIISKGTVQAEELRGQIGERIPGAFAIAAKSMGKTEAELNKMMATGKLASKDFIIPFTEALGKASQAAAGQNGLAANVNKINNAFEILKTRLGRGLLEPASLVGTLLEKALFYANKLLETQADKDAEKSQKAYNEALKETALLTDNGLRAQIIAEEIKLDRIKTTFDFVQSIAAKDGEVSESEKEKLTILQDQFTVQKSKLDAYNEELKSRLNSKKVETEIVETDKEKDKRVNEEYQNRLNLLELLKQQRILIGELYGDPLAKLGAEEAFLRDKLDLEKEYAAKGVKITEEQIEVTTLARQVAEQEFNQEAERLRMENYKGAIKDEKDFLKEREKLIKDFSDKASDLAKKNSELYNYLIDRETKKFKEAEEIKIAAINLTSTIATGAFELYLASISKQITMLNKRADEEVRLADGNEQKIAEINQKRQQKQAELQRKQFEAERLAAIARVVFETAAMIAKWSSNPVTAPLAALSLAAQAAQIGFILAQPVPEFAEGTKGKPFEGGLAMVGEKGVEKVVTKSGKVYFTPHTATLVDLPKGSQVIPNSSLSKQEVFWANRLSGGQSTANPMVGKLDELGSILKGLPITQLNMDERGFEKYIRTERRTTKILNNRFRSSQ